jgi:thiol-disulfide isomerase/thioredoxin
MFNSKNMNMLTSKHFTDKGLVHKNFKNGGLFVIYADWCHFCQELKPIWKELFIISKNKNYGIGAINSDKEKVSVNMMGVSGFPTIIEIKKNGKMKEYTGKRNLIDLKKKLPK